MKDLDTTTKEGKLLYAAVCVLKSDGPENVKGKEADEIIAELDKLVEFLDSFKM